MTNGSRNNPWKLAAVAMALVIVTVVATGLVVANWGDKKMVDVSPGHATPSAATPSAVPAASTTAGVPTQSAVDACNQSAAAQAGQRENTKDTVIAGAIGAVARAAVGAAGGAVVAGGSGAGKGAVIGGLVGAGGGTLYGLNEQEARRELP